MKALVIASLVAALLAAPAHAQSNPFKGIERAMERVAAEGSKAAQRIDAGLARVEARDDACGERANGSGLAYVDCFIVEPIATSRPVVAARSWSIETWRRISNP